MTPLLLALAPENDAIIGRRNTAVGERRLLIAFCSLKDAIGCSQMPTCCAVGCSNSIAKGDKLFAVPRGKENVKRRAIWLHRIGRKNFDCQDGRLS
uniref:Apoptosis associated protein n=1 Tax=Rhipicephalus appendiculatus TaxID=34631 RepID=A0A131YKH5_RHIAP